MPRASDPVRDAWVRELRSRRLKMGEIAEMTGLTVATVWRILNAEHVRRKQRERYDAARGRQRCPACGGVVRRKEGR